MAEKNITTTVSNEFTYSGVPIIIICILGVASNVLLLVAFIKDPLKCFRNSGTYLVMNLAVSDCLMCLLGPFVHTMIIPRPGLLDEIFAFLMVWFGMSSFLSIISISIDRFLMVAYPIKHRVLIEGKVILLLLATIWIASCVSPLLKLFNIYDPQKNNTINIYTLAVISVIISAVMYASTYRKLKKKSRNIALQNSNGSRAQEIRILKEKQFLQTIMIIACIAFVCVVPSMAFFQAYDTLGFGREKNLASEILSTIFLPIFYINFAVNPLIYVVRLPNYRKTFYLLYCKRGT
jgi:hypothetical protein